MASYETTHDVQSGADRLAGRGAVIGREKRKRLRKLQRKVCMRRGQQLLYAESPQSQTRGPTQAPPNGVSARQTMCQAHLESTPKLDDIDRINASSQLRHSASDAPTSATMPVCIPNTRTLVRPLKERLSSRRVRKRRAHSVSMTK